MTPSRRGKCSSEQLGLASTRGARQVPVDKVCNKTVSDDNEQVKSMQKAANSTHQCPDGNQCSKNRVVTELLNRE